MNKLNFLILFSALLFFVSCSSSDKNDLNTAAGLYNSGIKLEEEERFEEALQRFADVKNKHPYSRFATDAELKIADVHFKREAYIESKGAYQTFKELHPKHPKSDYVTYRLALSLYNQMPSTIDRDISVASEAIQYFDELTESYKSSSFVEDARKKKAELLNKQAEKELYIADFYLKKEQYSSALKRFEFVLKKYANLGLDAKALYGAFRSAAESGERESAKNYFKKLKENYPSSTEAQNAQSKAGSYGL